MDSITEIYNFLKKFSHSLIDEHKNRLTNIQSELININTQKVYNNKHGIHYETCPWSKEENCEGPDTCPCSSTILKEREARKIMEIYYNIYNLSKCKNCNFKI